MKRHFAALITVVSVLAITAATIFIPGGHGTVSACGWGNSGGDDYVPQRRDLSANRSGNPAITSEQAQQLVAGHIRKLNPELKVGSINDAGGFYEAEIVSKDGALLQLLGVDKASGRLMLLN